MKPEDKLEDGLEDKIDELVARKGVTRRDFMKFCGLMAATLGLEASFISSTVLVAG